MLLLQAASSLPDNQRLLFVVSVVVVASVVVFTAGVIVTLVRRSDRRRAEEDKLAAIGTATARIMHQIKNPLQTIVLHSDLLNDERLVSDPAQRREISDAIVSESQRLVDMLEELSVYASGAKRALNRQPVALHDLVRQVAATEARDTTGSGLRVDSHRIEPAVVFADGYYMRQALENLVRNACEAMAGQENARLTLSVERDAGVAVVRVADNGPGIPPEKLDRIFQPFVSTKGKGMGLGLAICREIVEAHAGRLEVESQVGQGTTFVMRLPLYGDGLTAAAPVADAREPEAAWS